MVDPKFVVNLKGKEFVMLGGLLALGHEMGLMSLETQIVSEMCNLAERSFVVKATGTFSNSKGGGTWSAYGDASPANSQMRGAELRHAETRAVARMLRLATNVATTAFEELGPDEEPPAAHRPEAQPAKHAQQCEYKSKEGTPCKRYLTGDQCAASKKATGHYLCPEHLGIVQRVRAQKATQAAVDETLQEAEAAT